MGGGGGGEGGAGGGGGVTEEGEEEEGTVRCVEEQTLVEDVEPLVVQGALERRSRISRISRGCRIFCGRIRGLLRIFCKIFRWI